MTNNRRVVLIVGVVLVLAGVSFILYRPPRVPTSGELKLIPTTGSITVLYDNYLFEGNCRAEWGYSCLVETPDITILFDTGGDPEILAHNIETLDIDIQSIDCIVLSHEHWDHVGGIATILGQKQDIPVYIPNGFPEETKNNIIQLGGNIIEQENATRITDSIAVTDTLNGPPEEHALIIKTNDGVILVTGCSHPGVDDLALNTAELTEDSIQLVIGGYHLGGATNYMLGRICDKLDEAGVLCVSATHCTGDEAIAYFRERYSEDYIESGVGFHYEF